MSPLTTSGLRILINTRSRYWKHSIRPTEVDKFIRRKTQTIFNRCLDEKKNQCSLSCYGNVTRGCSLGKRGASSKQSNDLRAVEYNSCSCNRIRRSKRAVVFIGMQGADRGIYRLALSGIDRSVQAFEKG